MVSYLQLTNIYYFEATEDRQKLDTLLALYDEMDAEAQRQKHEQAGGVIRINKMNILVTAQQYEEAVRLAPDYLHYMEATGLWNSYYYIYYSLINAHRNLGNTDEAMGAVDAMYQHAKEKGNNIGMGTSLFLMGRIYNDQNRLAEEEKCLREAIVVLRDSALNKSVDVYHHLGLCLIGQERYREALQVAGDMEPVIKRYEEAGGAPVPNAWYNQYQIYISAYIELKQYDHAEVYCNKVEQMSNGAITPYAARAAIFASRKQYTKALEMANRAIENADPKGKLTAMKAKMGILLQQAGSQEMEKLFAGIIDLLVWEHNERTNAQLDKIRTQYEVDKITAQNERMEIEKSRNRNYFLFSLCACLLLAVLSGVFIYYNRLITHKNRGLYLQIKEQDRLTQELEALASQYRPHEPDEGAPGNPQQRELVSRLRDYLLSNKNFTKPDIERQELIVALTTNKTYLFESVKAVTGKTLQEYVNLLRVEEAKQLFDHHPDYTVDMVAQACGFHSVRTFYRLFSEQYRITPGEFKKMARLQEQL